MKDYLEWVAKEEPVISTERLISKLFDDKLNGDELLVWMSSHTNEGALYKIIGGATGLVLGRKIGNLIAKALGIENGILFDILTSRVVAARIGIALSKKRKQKSGLSLS
ncbi:hypothetical protein [Ekhidna sp.]|uniref:hypothetical protein n=1 Tax=Ekhidna sp. TaxID=2608089 RepID=UPI0032968EB0